MSDLKSATDRAQAAIEAADLAALDRALKARRKAIDSGDRATPDVYEAGQRLMRALIDYQRQAAYASARIEQIRRYVQFQGRPR